MRITRAQALRIVDILFEDTTSQGNIDGYKASRFDDVLPVMRSIDEAAPVLVDTWPTAKDAPVPLAHVRTHLNELIRDHSLSQTHGYHLKFSKLLGIVEQIIMKLENVPTFKTIPGMAPFPVMPTYPAIVTPAPAWPNTFPFNQPTTIKCGPNTRAQQAMCQADGHVPSTVEDDSIPF